MFSIASESVFKHKYWELNESNDYFISQTSALAKSNVQFGLVVSINSCSDLKLFIVNSLDWADIDEKPEFIANFDIDGKKFAIKISRNPIEPFSKDKGKYFSSEGLPVDFLEAFQNGKVLRIEIIDSTQEKKLLGEFSLKGSSAVLRKMDEICKSSKDKSSSNQSQNKLKVGDVDVHPGCLYELMTKINGDSIIRSIALKYFIRGCIDSNEYSNSYESSDGWLTFKYDEVNNFGYKVIKSIENKFFAIRVFESTGGSFNSKSVLYLHLHNLVSFDFDNKNVMNSQLFPVLEKLGQASSNLSDEQLTKNLQEIIKKIK